MVASIVATDAAVMGSFEAVRRSFEVPYPPRPKADRTLDQV